MTALRQEELEELGCDVDKEYMVNYCGVYV